MPWIYEPAGMAREYAERACNIYRGCEHGCIYCYAPSCLRMKAADFHAASVGRKGVVRGVREEAGRLNGDARRVLLCFTCDPYGPSEQGLTREVIRALRDAGRPFQVLTKGGTRAVRDFDLYADGAGWFGTTLAWTNDADRAKWEPKAASVEDRVEALWAAKRLGIRTWVSVEPVIDPAQALELVTCMGDVVDEWKVGKLNHAQAPGVDWGDFAIRVLAALQATGRSYLVKDALAAFLPRGSEVRRLVG